MLNVFAVFIIVTRYYTVNYIPYDECACVCVYHRATALELYGSVETNPFCVVTRINVNSHLCPALSRYTLSQETEREMPDVRT